MVVMVPAMVTPMMVTPVPEMTDAAWTVVGPDDRAAAVGVVIGVIVVIGVGRSIEEPPMKVMPVMESDAAAMEGHAPVKRAALKCSATTASTTAGVKRGAAWSDAAAMECRATSMEAPSAAMTASAATAVTTTSASAAATMTAAHFDDRRTGSCARDRRGTRIDQRQRASVLT